MRTSVLLAPLTFLFACAAPVDAESPSAQLDAPTSAVVGETLFLSGDASRGVDLRFAWRIAATPPGSLLDERDLLGVDSPQAAFTPDVAGRFTLTLTACDAWSRCALSELELDVEPSARLRPMVSADALSPALVEPNRAPQAHAQASIGRSGGDGAPWVFLDGQQSADPDGDSLRYTWSFASRPADSALGQREIDGQGEERAAFRPDVAGTWVLRLTVSDLSASSTTILEDILIDDVTWDVDRPTD